MVWLVLHRRLVNGVAEAQQLQPQRALGRLRQSDARRRVAVEGDVGVKIASHFANALA